MFCSFKYGVEGFYGFASKMHIKNVLALSLKCTHFFCSIFPAFFQPSRLVAYYYSTFLYTFRCTYATRFFKQFRSIFTAPCNFSFRPAAYLPSVFLRVYTAFAWCFSSFEVFHALFFISILIRSLLLQLVFVTWFLFIYLFMFYLRNFPVLCRANPYRFQISEKRWFDIHRERAGGEGNNSNARLFLVYYRKIFKLSYLFARKNAHHNMKSHLRCAAAYRFHSAQVPT